MILYGTCVWNSAHWLLVGARAGRKLFPFHPPVAAIVISESETREREAKYRKSMFCYHLWARKQMRSFLQSWALQISCSLCAAPAGTPHTQNPSICVLQIEQQTLFLVSPSSRPEWNCWPPRHEMYFVSLCDPHHMGHAHSRYLAHLAWNFSLENNDTWNCAHFHAENWVVIRQINIWS